MNFSSCRADRMCPDLYDALAAYRYRVFVERLGWELQTIPGYEQDQFDHGETVHIVARNDAGGIVGCGRLLPTTGDYLLESVFPELLNGLPRPRHEQVWELSRFAAMELDRSVDAGHAAAAATGAGTARRRTHLAERVLLEALRFCDKHMVTQLLAVSTLPVERLLKRAGVDVVRLGPPSTIGGQQVLAFVIGVHARSIEALAVFEAAANGGEALPPRPTRDGSGSRDALRLLEGLAAAQPGAPAAGCGTSLEAGVQALVAARHAARLAA